jgi:hypothetical protein
MCCNYLGHHPGLRNQADFSRQTHLAYRDFTRMYAVSGLVLTVRKVSSLTEIHTKTARLRQDFVTVGYNIR